MRCLLLVVAFLSTAVTRVPVATAEAPRALLITGARVLDPAGEHWLDGRAVFIEGGRIAAVAPRDAIRPPEGAQRIDASGLFLIPGLIDLHTHLLLHPYDEASWDDQVLRESLELRTIRAVAAARATLEAGFTTIRDLGTEGAALADVALRDAASRGIMAGPRVFAATRAIVARACYGPQGLDPRWQQAPVGAQEVNGVDEMRRAVREQIAAGADWVKVYADYRRAPGAAATPTLTVEEIKAAVEEAASAGLPVAAHATTDEGIQRAVLAGVATIEHGYGASRETLVLMREKGVVLCPTLAAADAVARYALWDGDEPAPDAVRLSRESFRMAREVGVTIACGSDAGVFAHGANAREIELMVQNGMTPGEALRSATGVAAGVLRKGEFLGSVEPGKLADVVCVRGDPLKDVGALRAVAVVVGRGRVVVGRPE